MIENERLDYLVGILLRENNEYSGIAIPGSVAEKRRLLRALMNVRPPLPVTDDFVALQDEELQKQLKEKGTVDVGELSYKGKGRYAIWQGDITRLKVDAIVNAANSRMLGCFVPLHGCIDNAIHSAAGVQLRLACNEIMNKKGHEEPTGEAIVTPGFNLPAKYVIHTVGPIVYGDRPTDEDCRLLASCYRSCLEAAEQYHLKSIAFCCISTGEFRFPNREAAEIALETVDSYFSEHPDSTIKKVIFNVFKDKDRQIYAQLLRAD